MATCTELGCGEPRVLIASRCGEQVICDVTDHLSALEWSRQIDDTSEAVFTVSLTGQGDGACCDCLGDLRSWLHSVVIYRDGEIVWGPGPITNILYKRDQVTITARDMSAWLDVRIIRTGSQLVFTNMTALQIARKLIQDAMGPDDPCDVAGRLIVVEPDTSVVMSKTFEPDKTYVGDALRELARTAIDYTTIGSSIILGAPLAWGPFGILMDADFQTDIEIEERGIETATKWYVDGNGVTGVAATNPDPDTFLGLIEQAASEENATSQAQVDAAAAGRLEASYPPPVYVNIPDGARINPSAGVCMDQLIPGAVFNVVLTELCRKVSEQYRLTAIKVSYPGDGDEQVGATLAPNGIGFTQGTVGPQTGVA